ncbi:inward rectifier potassium channel 13 [Seriola lalandi dorsalis]|uniref:Inward rectifier potassium channel 13 n=2 Tax=Seriola TaxID=8160 RepID=A0A3B4TY37_SERDU|nr:inward rectifier potassium channel 13 [Seriola dumerili]XP_023272224.1 inward rectifier potassium channel 13 [Seriola lalandi dorsalis]XP_056230463.1 inward rectifier potassium channel 13 [Seriola aureovittata]
MTTKSTSSVLGGKASSSPLLSSPPRQRLVTKDGHCALRPPLCPSGSWRGASGRAWLLALQDLWGLLVGLRWRWVLLAFCASFLAHWLLFACLWYLLAHLNGDLAVQDHDAPPQGHVVCVKHITSFTAAFSFSLETQLTIGYGTMFPSGDCPSAIALLAVQMLLGLMLEAFITGAFVAKIARPQKRAGAIQFSPQAVVGQHQGQTCLMLRATNLLQRPLVDVKVSAVLYEEHEGQALHQTSLDFHLDSLGQQPCPFFIFPLTFYHPLDRRSPLYPALCEGMSNHFELVVFLSALQEGTGDSCQKRTSYLRQEIQFDRRFVPALGLDARGRYMVSTQHFDTAHSKEPLNKDCVVQINGDGSDRME